MELERSLSDDDVLDISEAPEALHSFDLAALGAGGEGVGFGSQFGQFGQFGSQPAASHVPRAQLVDADYLKPGEGGHAGHALACTREGNSSLHCLPLPAGKDFGQDVFDERDVEPRS
jgi:hypothetical protein